MSQRRLVHMASRNGSVTNVYHTRRVAALRPLPVLVELCGGHVPATAADPEPQMVVVMVMGFWEVVVVLMVVVVVVRMVVVVVRMVLVLVMMVMVLVVGSGW